MPSFGPSNRRDRFSYAVPNDPTLFWIDFASFSYAVGGVKHCGNYTALPAFRASEHGSQRDSADYFLGKVRPSFTRLVIDMLERSVNVLQDEIDSRLNAHRAIGTNCIDV